MDKRKIIIFMTIIGLTLSATAQYNPSGNCRIFNGTSDAINYNDVGDWMSGTNSPWTVECWMYTTVEANNNTVSTFQTPLGIDCQLAGGNVPVCYFDNAASGRNHTGVTNIPYNTWTHVSWVWEPSTLKMTTYVNGKYDKTTVFSAGASATSRFAVGAKPAGAGNWLHGGMMELRVWHVAKTTETINRDMFFIIDENIDLEFKPDLAHAECFCLSKDSFTPVSIAGTNISETTRPYPILRRR